MISALVDVLFISFQFKVLRTFLKKLENLSFENSDLPADFTVKNCNIFISIGHDVSDFFESASDFLI